MPILISLDSYHPDYILNFDETMIMRDPPVKRTINNIGDKRVAIKTAGKDKLGYTIGQLITLSGNLLRTLLVWPTKGVKGFKINIPLNLYICYLGGYQSN